MENSNNSDIYVKSLMNNFEKIAINVMKSMLGNAVFVKPATVTQISSDGLKASIQIVGETTIIPNVEVYNVRKINVGDTCFVAHWGANGKRLSNMAVLFGGTQFRE